MPRAASSVVAVLLSCCAARGQGPASQVAGAVLGAAGPLVGAVVRVQTSGRFALTDRDGSFVLEDEALLAGQVRITAWAPGHFIGWAQASPGDRDVVISLRPHYTTDNPDHAWFANEGIAGSQSCRICMPGPYAEWAADAHSQSAVNPRFLSMYAGTDLRGHRSPPRRYATDRDYGQVPLPPRADEPYYGPGYKLDYPDTAGNCAACHAPAATAYPGGAYAAEVTGLEGVPAEGVFCEFCHKIGDVILDPTSGLPRPNMPGPLSMRLHRPSEGEELFFGPFDDVTRRVTYLPLQQQSAFCAPCHFGVFWNTAIYNSYGEWLASPYADPRTGQTCQDCHMPLTEATAFALPEVGGLHRSPGRIRSHRMPGAADRELLQHAARLDVDAKRAADRIRVEARVTNEGAGHHLPTDHPARHIVLVLRASGPAGQELPLLTGPLVPAWVGVGDAPQDYGQRPGRVYAKVLEELWTGVLPTAAYWNPTILREDTRLPAKATEVSTYEFRGLEGPATVHAKLVFRRAFRELAQQKGWNDPDIVMQQRELMVP